MFELSNSFPIYILYFFKKKGDESWSLKTKYNYSLIIYYIHHKSCTFDLINKYLDLSANHTFSGSV